MNQVILLDDADMAAITDRAMDGSDTVEQRDPK